MAADLVLCPAALLGWAEHGMATGAQTSQLEQQGNSLCKQQMKPPKRAWPWSMGTPCPGQSRWSVPLMPLHHLQEVLQLLLSLGAASRMPGPWPPGV